MNRELVTVRAKTLHVIACQVMRLAEFRFLAGLEVKLYSDVPHHAEQLVDLAGGMHADMQEGLPMTDVLVMVDDWDLQRQNVVESGHGGRDR